MPGKSRIALIATVVVVTFGAAWLFIRPRPADEAPRPTVEAPIAAAAAAPAEAEAVQADAAAAPVDVAPPEMMETMTALEAQYAERRDEIPEELAKPIEDDIGLIEGLAADLLAALANEPDNEDLKRMLVQTYRNEMKLLKKALHLSSVEDDAEVVVPEPLPAAAN